MNETPNRAPTVVWSLRPSNINSYVRTGTDDTIEVILDSVIELRVSRVDARLIARRINQCLDATTKE